MTYADLAAKIFNMTDEQRNMDVTFFDEENDEFFALIAVVYANPDYNDVIDPNHPYLIAA